MFAPPVQLLGTATGIALIFCACASSQTGSQGTEPKTKTETTKSAPAAPTPKPVTKVVSKPAHPTQIKAGRKHLCVLRDNQVRCWGNNGRGRLGDGTQLDRKEAVPVIGLPKGRITELFLGEDTSCVLFANHHAWCWGDYNSPHQRAFKPGRVFGLGDHITDLALGSDHLCALSDKGVVRCTGRNYQGQLGHPQMRFSSTAVVKLAEPATALFGLVESTCASLRSGKLACWGRHVNGLFGKPGTGCLKLPGAAAKAPRRGVGCSYIPENVAWVKSPLEAMLARDGRDLCVLTSQGQVSCLLNRKRYLVVPANSTQLAAAEMAIGELICVRSPDGRVLCAGRRAEVCAEVRGRRRCRGTISSATGPNWDSAFIPLEDITDAVGVASTRSEVCAVQRSGPIRCVTVKRDRSRHSVVIKWRKSGSLDAEKATAAAAQKKLRALASTDLFAGARWLMKAQVTTFSAERDQLYLAKRLIQAGRTAEGLTLAGRVAKFVGSEMKNSADAGRCELAARLTQVPVERLWYDLAHVIKRCAARWEPDLAKLVVARLLDGIDTSPEASTRYRLLAELYGRRGQTAKAATHYTKTTRRDRGRAYVLTAIELGYGQVVATEFERFVRRLPEALAALVRAPKGDVGIKLDTRPPYRLAARVKEVRLLAPALRRMGMTKEAKQVTDLAFKAIEVNPMGGLFKAQLYAQVAEAAAKSGSKRGGVRKRLRKASSWLKTGLKAVAAAKAAGGKPKKHDHLVRMTRLALAAGWIAVSDMKSAMAQARHLSNHDLNKEILPVLFSARRFGEAARLADGMEQEWAKKGVRKHLLLAAALARNCKVVGSVSKKLPLYELKPDKVETVATACPKETAATMATIDVTKALRRPSLAIFRATQGQWIPALQAVASVSAHERAKTWAHVAALWQLAGAPKPANLKAVVEAILE